VAEKAENSGGAGEAPDASRAGHGTILAEEPDMGEPYLQVVRLRAPQATICFDRFHVVRHLNAAVDEVRRSLVRQLAGPARAMVKAVRFVLLKNPWNQTPKQKQALSALVRSNNPLSRAWYLKEDFQKFWDYRHEGWATRHIKHWLWSASHSRLEPFKAFARLVRKHLDGILAWTRLRITNGALKGMNNKVKLVSHRCYGFRNDDRYIEAIYHNGGCCPCRQRTSPESPVQDRQKSHSFLHTSLATLL